MRSTKKLVRADGSEEWLPAKCDGVDVKEGDVLYFNTWGGGGWGNPLERDPELVQVDVARGLVSRDGAQRYGVVISGDGAIDAKATEKLRGKMSGSRGEMGLFNFGGTIDEIKARSLAETHLPAPEPPNA
jgi:N-methylhydantoinase B